MECDAGVTMSTELNMPVSSLPGQTLRLCALVTLVGQHWSSPTGVSHVVALEEPTPTVATQGPSTTFSCKVFLLRCVVLRFTTYLQCIM